MDCLSLIIRTCVLVVFLGCLGGKGGERTIQSNVCFDGFEVQVCKVAWSYLRSVTELLTGTLPLRHCRTLFGHGPWSLPMMAGGECGVRRSSPVVHDEQVSGRGGDSSSSARERCRTTGKTREVKRSVPYPVPERSGLKEWNA